MTNKMPALFLAAVCAAPAFGQLKDARRRRPGSRSSSVQEIATDLKIGYAVHVCDVNGDGKPDIVVRGQGAGRLVREPDLEDADDHHGQVKAGQRLHRVAGHRRRWQNRLRTRGGWRPSDTKTPGTFNG